MDLASQAYLDDFTQVLNQCQRVVLGQPLDAEMELVLLAFAVPDVPHIGYQLESVQSILLPRLWRAVNVMSEREFE